MHFLVGLLIGCSSEAETTPAPDTLNENTTLSTSSELPDLTTGLSKTGCDNGPGGAGAASYFVGELKITDGNVTGEEQWLLYANKQWKAGEGKDCVVRWTLNGNTNPIQACGSCSVGVSLTNAMDKVGSTCPEKIAENETGQAINYDISLLEDGRAIVYFSRSGKKVGEGYHQNGTIKYVTDLSCRWF
jgi:hypothetical protein